MPVVQCEPTDQDWRQTRSLNFWLLPPDKVNLLVQMDFRIIQVTLDLGKEDLDLLLAPTEDATKESRSIRVDDLGFLNSLELAEFLESRILCPWTQGNLSRSAHLFCS